MRKKDSIIHSTFNELIKSYGFELHSTDFVTRKTSTSATSIDQVFSNIDAKVELIESSITDNYPFLIKLPLNKSEKRNQRNTET